MGMLVDGQWREEDLSEFARDGRRVRFDAGFHDWIRADDSSAFAPEPGRYRLYCNRTCPWSHRAVATRAVKGLQDVIEEVLLEPAMGEQGWWFGDDGNYRDPARGATHLHELYSATDPSFTGRVSVPVLWDKRTERIVNNDSGAIARMLNDEFNEFARHPEVNMYPLSKRELIDELNDRVASDLTDGVYRCLLAKSQADYELALTRVFDTLTELDGRLEHSRFLIGDNPTEPDWRLFAVLIRFDAVYYPAYHCNLRRIVDFDNLWPYVCDLYHLGGIADTVDMATMKRGYFVTLGHSIVPKGPLLDFSDDGKRARLGSN